jgi:dTDP-4-dehydrorhamnose reductase
MNESEILIIGAGGQLGKALQSKYPGAKKADLAELNIADEQQVLNYNWDGIKTILNAAAYTNVDGAETQEGRISAWQANASAVRNLVNIGIKHDLTIVHLSTDYVFDGTREMHNETENFSPLSVYGQSKAAGDIALSLLPKNYILRTSWVIGDGKNFVRTMLELGKKGVAPTVVSDQKGRLTFTSELVKAIDHLLTNNAPYGVYNVTNDGDIVSWAGITRAIFKEAGFDLIVSDTTTAEYFASKENVAPRPLNSQLDLSKITQSGFTPSNWRDDLHEYIKKELSQ